MSAEYCKLAMLYQKRKAENLKTDLEEYFISKLADYYQVGLADHLKKIIAKPPKYT